MGGDGITLINQSTGDVVNCESWTDSVPSGADIMRIAHYLNWDRTDVLMSKSDKGYKHGHLLNATGDTVEYTEVFDGKPLNHLISKAANPDQHLDTDAATQQLSLRTHCRCTVSRPTTQCTRTVRCDYFDSEDGRFRYNFWIPNAVSITQTVSGVNYTIRQQWDANFNHYPDWQRHDLSHLSV